MLEPSNSRAVSGSQLDPVSKLGDKNYKVTSTFTDMLVLYKFYIRIIYLISSLFVKFPVFISLVKSIKWSIRT